MTTIKGNPKMLANSKVSDLNGVLPMPETTQSAY